MTGCGSGKARVPSCGKCGHDNSPVAPAKPEKRGLDGLYLDQPEEWDDPYRFFRW